MGDENKSKEQQFFETMGDLVSRNRSQLTDDKSVPGTDLGFIELLNLKSAYNKFERECVPKLSAGSECTTVFNTTGGKKLDVAVSMQAGVAIHITGTEGQKRKVSFKPPGAM